jgi:hypothetical protein
MAVPTPSLSALPRRCRAGRAVHRREDRWRAAGRPRGFPEVNARGYAKPGHDLVTPRDRIAEREARCQIERHGGVNEPALVICHVGGGRRRAPPSGRRAGGRAGRGNIPRAPIKLSASLRAQSAAIAAAAVSRSTWPVRCRAGNRSGSLRAADRAAGFADIHVAGNSLFSQYFGAPSMIT